MPLWLFFPMILGPVLTGSISEQIEVLVFLPHNDSFLFSRARVAPAILYAQRELRAGAKFSGLRFNIHFEDSDWTNSAMLTLVDRSCSQKPDLILGPVREYEAAGVVRLATHWRIPVISAGALAAAFGIKDAEFSHLTRIGPSYLKMAETFRAMFTRFGWRSALLVYEDDKRDRDCYFTLEGVHQLMEDQMFRVHAVAEEDPPHTEEVLQDIQDHEVVIMCMKADRVRDLMLAAHRKQLTGGRHVFFNVELFNASAYGNGSWRRGDQDDDLARQAFASLNTVTLLRTLKPEFENFSVEMRRSMESSGLSDCRDCGNVNMFVEGFHDALLLYALALQDATENGYSKQNGTEITFHMWNRTFEGIAGPVSMDTNGDRHGDFSVMAMTDAEAGTYEVVADYFGASGSFQLQPGFNEDRFFLTGRDAGPDLPEKPEKSCELGVSALTGVGVGAVLGAAMLIAFYFFRKNYRITIQRRSHGDERDSAKHRQLREDSLRSNFSAA